MESLLPSLGFGIAVVVVVLFVAAICYWTMEPYWAWEKSQEGRTYALAVSSWLLAPAQVQAFQWEGPAVSRPWRKRVVRRYAGGILRYPESGVEMRRWGLLSLRLRTVEGDFVDAQRRVTVPLADAERIQVGALIQVLYSPAEKTNFTIDTLQREEVIWDAAVLRTQSAERAHATRMAFEASRR